jgi:serine/threonine-protein kinase
LPRDIPADVRTLVEQTMAKDPAARIPDGAALLTAVDRVLAGRSPAPVSPSTAPIAAVAPDGPAGPTGTAVMPLPVLPPTERAAARPAPVQRTAVRDAEPPARRRRPVALIVGALVALAVVAAVVIAMTALSGTDTPDDSAGSATTTSATTTTPTTTTPTAPPTVDLDPNAYIGRPVADVQAELTALGLTVEVTEVETADMDEGLVVDLTPVQGLASGATVTVSEAVAPADEGGNGPGNGGKKKKKNRD